MATIGKMVHDATQDAVNGLRVLVLTNSMKSATDLHKAFEAVDIGDIPRKISRVAGRLGADFPEHGGSIQFRSIASRGGRGMSIDHVYVPAGISHEAMEDIAPAVQASKSPAIIGYLGGIN